MELFDIFSQDSAFLKMSNAASDGLMNLCHCGCLGQGIAVVQSLSSAQNLDRYDVLRVPANLSRFANGPGTHTDKILLTG
jgi:hypothetical protein